jgi:hypothetical protein
MIIINKIKCVLTKGNSKGQGTATLNVLIDEIRLKTIWKPGKGK